MAFRSQAGYGALLFLALAACSSGTEPEPGPEPTKPITGPFAAAVVSGGDQSIARGAAAPAAMVVELRDAHGRVAPGVGVRWMVTSDVTLQSADGVTGADGRATARMRTLCSSPAGAVRAAASSSAANEASFTYAVVGGPATSLFTTDSVHLLGNDRYSARLAPRDGCGPLPIPTAVAWTSSNSDVAKLIPGTEAHAADFFGMDVGRAFIIAAASGGTDSLRVAVHPIVTGMRTLAVTQGPGCGLDAAGDVHCWGGSGGTVADEAAALKPVGMRPVLSGSGFTRLVGSGAHYCGLDASGTLYCWGSNQFGLVGDGTTTARTAPVAVGGSLRFTDVSSGGLHTCAVTTDGVAYCWGRNANGQLGDGTTTDRLAPVAVSTSLRFTHVSAGMRFTCGITSDGTTYCWGDGPDPWGSWTNKAVTSPVLLEGVPTLKRLAIGYSNACGLTATGGEAWCWGLSPAHFGEQFLPVVDAPPMRIGGTRSYATIAVGVAHACATTPAGEVDCWGANEKAQLGPVAGSITRRFDAAPMWGTGGPPLTAVFAPVSGNFTCGITAAGSFVAAGEVICWGQSNPGFDYPYVANCTWGSGIAARNYPCVQPRKVGAVVP